MLFTALVADGLCCRCVLLSWVVSLLLNAGSLGVIDQRLAATAFPFCRRLVDAGDCFTRNGTGQKKIGREWLRRGDDITAVLFGEPAMIWGITSPRKLTSKLDVVQTVVLISGRVTSYI